jgi:hypothetical protein
MPDGPPGNDCFAPPATPCECWCLHCQRVFPSDEIWFQRIIRNGQPDDGFWMCPTPNCGGAGFTFDLFPTDPDHPANAGWVSCDEYDDETVEAGDDDDESTEYDPAETKYKELDDELGDPTDDIEAGDEWKLLGAAPDGESFAAAEEAGRLAWEAEQRKYDAPDERPREIHSDDPPINRPPSGKWSDDDIPF